MARLTIEISDEVEKSFDEYVASNGLSKAKAGGVLVEQALASLKNREDEIKNINASLNKLVDNDRETQIVLEQIENTMASFFGMYVWLLPQICERIQKGNPFIDYFSECKPNKILKISRQLGLNLLDYGWNMPCALKDLPNQVDINTNELIGASLKTWIKICTKQIEEEKKSNAND